MKIKYIALCLLLVFVGCQRDEEMEIGQVSVSNERLEASYSSVEISCTFQTNVTIKNVKAYLSTTEEFSSATSYSLTEKAKNTFGANIEGLKDASTYYVRYEISNRWSSKMVDDVSEFNTIPYTTPNVQTNEVTDVTYNSAIVGATIKENGGQEIKECGIVYSKSPNPTIENGTKVESNIIKEAYTCTLTNLDFATTYYARAYAINEKGIAYGEEVSFKTNGTTASLDTLSISGVTATSAVISGALLNNGGESITALGVCYGVNQSPTLENATVINAELDDLKFSVRLNDLQKGTMYYVRAYATNSHGTVYSEELYFNTEITIPAVSSTPATDISYTSATVGGNVTDDGGASVTERGVCYSISANPTTANTKITSGSGLGEFTCNLTDLQDGVTYYARAYAINVKGIAYGDEVCFTTTTKTIATVATTPATDISYTSATVGGNVTDDGGASVTERGVCYSISANPTTANTKITSGSGLGEFMCSLIDLQDGTTFYVRAYAVNAKGTAYGEEVSFTTKTKTIATIATTPATKVSCTSATVGGNVTEDGGANVTERGICYSTSANPMTANTKVTSGIGTGSFTCNLTDLQDGTTYYVRAFATNAKGTAYGEEVSFTTKERYYENGYEYIDLGLSVKWATMNVGASSPDDYGDYFFAWGETAPKDYYNWSTYTLCKGSSTLTKYNTSSSHGTVDNKTQLELSDDAARANWGGSWRMPTDAELTELREQCTWTWTSQNGVNGYKVTSKSNGNSIFLPAAGYRYDSSLDDAGSFGLYWSSSLSTGRPYYAWGVEFASGLVTRFELSRDAGQSVRPVCP